MLAALALLAAPAYASSQAAVLPPSADPGDAFVRSLAISAATYGAPIVAMYNLRSTVTFGPNAQARPNDIWRLEDIATPQVAEQLGYVTPNVNVVYGFGFLDLDAQPIVLRVPDAQARYYMVEIVDMWSNAFAYVGGNATGYGGGTFALVGPNWHGRLPTGVRSIECPTRWVEIQPRVHVAGQHDLEDAQATLRGITVQGLAEYEHRPAPPVQRYDYATPRVDPNVASSLMQFTDPLQFWEIFSSAMNENPPPATEIATMLPQFKYLGIELGKPWRRSDVSPAVLEQMRIAAAQIGPMLNATGGAVGNVRAGWVIPPPEIGMPGADYVLRGAVAIFGLTSNTPAEAIYYQGILDSDGRPLTGSSRYKMTLRPPTPYVATAPSGFWSVTMYDGTTSYTVPNAIDRYALGSDDHMQRNSDGSVTIIIQRDDPGPAQRRNWLPAPAGPFYMTLRVYAPAPSLVAAIADPVTFQGPPPLVRRT